MYLTDDNYFRCEGILLESLRFQDIPNTDESELGLKVLKFIPRFSDRNDSNVSLRLKIFSLSSMSAAVHFCLPIFIPCEQQSFRT